LAPVTFGSETAAALVVANGAALLLGMALYRLIVHETGDEGAGRLAPWLLLAGPAAAPFVMGYAESLGAAASVLAVLAARRGRWWLAGLAGAAVGLTWSVGWLLVVPLLVEAVRGAQEASWPSRLARAAAVAGPAVVTAAYLWWVDIATGDGWGNVVTVQTTVFDRELLDPFSALYGAGEDLLVGHHASGLALPWALLAIVLAIVAFRRLPASYGAYLTVVLLVTISSRNIDSSERYLLRAFPLVIAGSLLLRREWQQRLAVTLGLGGLVIYTTAIFLGAKVP